MIGLNSVKLRARRETADPDMLQGTVKELISYSEIIETCFAKCDYILHKAQSSKRLNSEY